jgi:hypothetical protein
MLEHLLMALKVIAVAVVAFTATLIFIVLFEVVFEGGGNDD